MVRLGLRVCGKVMRASTPWCSLSSYETPPMQNVYDLCAASVFLGKRRGSLHLYRGVRRAVECTSGSAAGEFLNRLSVVERLPGNVDGRVKPAKFFPAPGSYGSAANSPAEVRAGCQRRVIKLCCKCLHVNQCAKLTARW